MLVASCSYMRARLMGNYNNPIGVVAIVLAIDYIASYMQQLQLISVIVAS